MVATATKAVSTPSSPPSPRPLPLLRSWGLASPPPPPRPPSSRKLVMGRYRRCRPRRRPIPMQMGPGRPGSMAGSDGEAAARQQPLPPPRPMTSPEEKVSTGVGPEQLVAMGGPGPSSSLPPSLEPGTAVAGVGALDAQPPPPTTPARSLATAEAAPHSQAAIGPAAALAQPVGVGPHATRAGAAALCPVAASERGSAGASLSSAASDLDAFLIHPSAPALSPSSTLSPQAAPSHPWSSAAGRSKARRWADDDLLDDSYAEEVQTTSMTPYLDAVH
ncbi:uncharacterized protein [Miscanthus floridulus]|uniref:uncharacterized protein n=1 Tax=Miscanthus floridulus TaxID=154761 RepID=UPI0034587070